MVILKIENLGIRIVLDNLTAYTKWDKRAVLFYNGELSIARLDVNDKENVDALLLEIDEVLGSTLKQAVINVKTPVEAARIGQDRYGD